MHQRRNIAPASVVKHSRQQGVLFVYKGALMIFNMESEVENLQKKYGFWTATAMVVGRCPPPSSRWFPWCLWQLWGVSAG